jgi:hypothetical protein
LRITGGRERTAVEYGALLEKAGFKMAPRHSDRIVYEHRQSYAGITIRNFGSIFRGVRGYLLNVLSAKLKDWNDEITLDNRSSS